MHWPGSIDDLISGGQALLVSLGLFIILYIISWVSSFAGPVCYALPGVFFCQLLRGAILSLYPWLLFNNYLSFYGYIKVAFISKNIDDDFKDAFIIINVFIYLDINVLFFFCFFNNVFWHLKCFFFIFTKFSLDSFSWMLLEHWWSLHWDLQWRLVFTMGFLFVNVDTSWV